MAKAEQEGEIAVNAIVPLEFTSGLDTFPGRCDFDKDTVLLDANRFIEGDELLGLVSKAI